MLHARLAQRIGSVPVVGVGMVVRHRLLFHKRSRDGSGKCNCFYTGHQRDQVHGVVYAIRVQQRETLDKYEGNGYRAGLVLVRSGHQWLRALTYLGLDEHLQEDLRPYDWYYHLVLAGATQHGLDRHYMATLRSITPQQDHDHARRTHHAHLVRRVTSI